jgi:hypothetical protein
MGHIRLGRLPRSKRWQQVVELLQLGADVETIAAAAAVAAERDLKRATDDPAFVQTLWLLTQLPLAARGPAFAADLQALGLSVADRPGLMEVVAAFTDAVDRHSRGLPGRTDLGEMAQMAAVESLVALIGQSLPSLFLPTPEEVQREIGRYASGDRFSLLAREFFARLTQRRLDYYLSRELANHIGPGARFGDDVARSAFNAALKRHCREASQIVKEFAGGWYGKNVYQNDGVQRSAIPRFAAVALKKMGAELRKRRDADA